MDEFEEIVNRKAKKIVDQESQNSQEKNSAIESFETQPDFIPNQKKSFEEHAKEIIGVRATENAIQDEELTRSVTDRKKAEILNHAEALLKKEEAENKKADTILQQANYGVYAGVAAYAGIKKALPQKMQKILFSILSGVQTVMLIIFGIPISIINIIADGIDSIVKKLGTLAKSTRWIVLAGICIGALFVIALVVKHFLQKFGVIS